MEGHGVGGDGGPVHELEVHGQVGSAHGQGSDGLVGAGEVEDDLLALRHGDDALLDEALEHLDEIGALLIGGALDAEVALVGADVEAVILGLLLRSLRRLLTKCERLR